MSSHNQYRNFFMKAMEKFNISSPADLKNDEQKKKFFNYVEKNWKSTNEEAEVYIEEITEANAFLAARAVAIWEGNDEFEFNGKIYPVVRVYEEDVEENFKQRLQNVGRRFTPSITTAVDSWKMDKMHDTVKAGLAKQQPKPKMPKKENYEMEEDEVEEGIIRNVGRGIKAGLKGAVTPVGSYLNSRKSDAIQRDLDKLKSTKASRQIDRARNLTKQTRGGAGFY